ncbi:hypothetical protein J3325_04330 [Leuconostoc mesenteroides]|uniref:hypothetical protein n=1 Tax=Leuconostoc mesenteroides TaxID=1245 RepID=UPI001CBB4447|nr:hypothetical protein [Leuconostoc mesenteroides]MBZ1527013.1 hypothetical protein [Leuconostoc mesenteroides]
MNKVNVWNDGTDNPFEFEMDDRELNEFCSFMHPQEVTDVFEHEQYGDTYFIIKGHVSMMSYRKKVGN